MGKFSSYVLACPFLGFVFLDFFLTLYAFPYCMRYYAYMYSSVGKVLVVCTRVRSLCTILSVCVPKLTVVV